jgi:arylformamidase
MSRIDITGNTVIDLSQSIEPGIPVPVGFPGPELNVFLSQAEGDVANVEILRLGLHTSTHCDAPFHFFTELRHVDELPPDCLIGSAVIVDLTSFEGSVAVKDSDLISWETESGETIREDDIVLLHTGHDQRWEVGECASEYWEGGWPHLDKTAVDLLVARKIKAVGVESFDPDWVDLKDLSSATFPSHRTFLPAGIFIVENLTNLDKIPGTRCHFIALPLKIKGGSGSPVRAIAII